MILITIILLQFVSAKFICQNNEEVITDQDEVDINSARIINSLGIGVIETDEVGVLRKFDATLLIDSAKVVISNQTSPQTIDLLTKSYIIGFVNSTSTTAKITVEGNSKEVEKETPIEIGGLTVFLVQTDSSETDTPNAKLVVGTKQIFLSNYEKQYEKVEVANKTFFITLYSSSDSNAILTVSKCEKSHITEIADEPKENEDVNITETNETNVEENVTQTNEREEVNVTEEQNITENNTENKTSGTSVEEAKPSIFKRFWNWLKNLFN